MEPDRDSKLTALYHAAGVKSALQIKHLLEGREQQQHQPTTDVDSTFECSVCCELVQADVSLRLPARALCTFLQQSASLAGCTHAFCLSCWRAHIGTALADAAYISCLQCAYLLDDDFIRRLVWATHGRHLMYRVCTPNGSAMYTRRLLDAVANNRTGPVRCCPAADCQFVVECSTLSIDEPLRAMCQCRQRFWSVCAGVRTPIHTVSRVCTMNGTSH